MPAPFRQIPRTYPAHPCAGVPARDPSPPPRTLATCGGWAHLGLFLLVVLCVAQTVWAQPTLPVPPTPSAASVQPQPPQNLRLPPPPGDEHIPPPVRMDALSIEGKLAPGDRLDRLRAFLDLRPPMSWDEATQARVARDLDALGYRASYDLRPIASSEGRTLVIRLTPQRVVRRIYISGDWPIFDWEVQSYLTWRAGYRLPDEDALAQELVKQEVDLVTFFRKKGYYDAAVHIRLDWLPDLPEQVDVRVQIQLNVGFFRLKYRIGEIRTTGATFLTQPQIASVFEHCCLWWGRTSDERISDDIKLLVNQYKAAGFIGVHVKRSIRPNWIFRRVDLDLEIEERRRILLYFRGRTRISESDLRGAVTIFRDNYASANELDESARNIFRLYQQRGFFEARVDWRWRDRTGDPMKVEFQVHEGPQFKVQAIEFQPSDPQQPLTFSSAKLAEQITTRRYPRLGVLGLGQGGYASAIQLEQDIRRIEDFYRRQGHPQAHVAVEVARGITALDHLPLLGLDTARDAAGKSANLVIRFRVEEGRREVVDGVEITFVGPHSQTADQIRKVLSLSAGKPYTTEAAAQDRQNLARLFSTVGRTFVEADAAQSTWNADHTRITIRWTINEGELVRFGPVLIRGNFVTRESVILSDLPFKTGDPFDSQKLLEAQQYLISRQIFSSVRVTANPGRTDEYEYEANRRGWSLARNPVPILIEVTERYDNVGELALYAGLSTDNPVYGQASYIWRNVFGTGLEVELRGELGIRAQSIVVRLAKPRLFTRYTRLDVSGFWRNENRISVGLVNFYGANAEISHVFLASADEQGRLIQPPLRLFGRLEFNFNQRQVPLDRTEGTTSLQSDGDRTQSLKFSVGVVWERREGLEAPGLRARGRPVPLNPIMPISGYYLSAQLTGSLCCSFGPFSADGSFVALTTQAMFLRPFGPELAPEDGWQYAGLRRFNIKFNLRVNYGIPLYRPTLPIVEFFFAGGDTTTRGYDLDSLRSEVDRTAVPGLPGTPAYRVVPQGGNIRILSQLEWEFAISSYLTFPWVGALFVDMGAVFDDWRRTNWNDFRFSVGVSFLRLLTPFGPISLDYAYPLVLPGQEALLQSERWKQEPWYSHFPGRIHFTWGLPLAF